MCLSQLNTLPSGGACSSTCQRVLKHSILSTQPYCAESAASDASAMNGKSSEAPSHGPAESADMLKRRESAEAVFAALFKAQEAASAAAKASGNTVQTLPSCQVSWAHVCYSPCNKTRLYRAPTPTCIASGGARALRVCVNWLRASA